MEIVEAIRDHHERLDGSGYPAGCSGSELGLPSRIIAVADALRSAKTYTITEEEELAVGGRPDANAQIS